MASEPSSLPPAMVWAMSFGSPSSGSHPNRASIRRCIDASGSCRSSFNSLIMRARCPSWARCSSKRFATCSRKMSTPASKSSLGTCPLASAKKLKGSIGVASVGRACKVTFWPSEVTLMLGHSQPPPMQAMSWARLHSMLGGDMPARAGSHRIRHQCQASHSAKQEAAILGPRWRFPPSFSAWVRRMPLTATRSSPKVASSSSGSTELTLRMASGRQSTAISRLLIDPLSPFVVDVFSKLVLTP